MKHNNPKLYELKKLREDIQREVKKKTKERVQEHINKELEKIKMSLKKEELLNTSGNLVREYPDGQRLTLEKLDIPEGEEYKGYLTNITDEDPLDLSISRNNLISKNMGRNTEFY